jgi:hypothetical protein
MIPADVKAEFLSHGMRGLGRYYEVHTTLGTPRVYSMDKVTKLVRVRKMGSRRWRDLGAL